MEEKVLPPIPRWTTGEVIKATLQVVLVALVFWLLLRFRNVIFILFSAIVISTAISPAVDWLHRRGLPRAAGVIFIYLLLLSMVAVFVLSLAPLVLNQAANISSDFSTMYQQVQEWLLTSPSLLIRRIALELPEEPPPVAPVEEDQRLTPGESTPLGSEAPSTTVQPVEDEVLGQVRQLFTYTGLVARSIFTALALFLLAFYWTLDGQRTIRSLLFLWEPSRRDDVRNIVVAIQESVGGYIRGIFILTLVVGIMATIAYALIGVPYAVLLGVIAGITEAIPVVGPTLGAIPALLVAYSYGTTEQVIAVLLAASAIQLAENLFLVPRIMGRSVGVNPLVSLLALVTFSTLLGFAGALLAIPIAAVLQILLYRFVLKPDVLVKNPPEGRDPLSVLRMEVKELTVDIRKQVREKQDQSDTETDVLEDSIEAIAAELDRLLEESTQQPEGPERAA